MLREELLKTWTNLKPKLSLYPTLRKNKELIKDALEFHANKSSEILNNNHSLMIRCQQNSKLATLSQEFTKEIDFSELEQLFNPNVPHTHENAQKWHDHVTLGNEARIWNGFFIQRQKNQAITENCKQLITKLQEF